MHSFHLVAKISTGNVNWKQFIGYLQIKHTISKLQAVVCSDGRFRAMREALHRCDPPCIPYLGIYLTDLSFIEEGTPDFTPDGLLNFSKMRMVRFLFFSNRFLGWHLKFINLNLIFVSVGSCDPRDSSFSANTIQNWAHTKSDHLFARWIIVVGRWWIVFKVTSNWTAYIPIECTEYNVSRLETKKKEQLWPWNLWAM